MSTVHGDTSPAPESLTAEERPRFDCFDGLRALAAIVVVAHHTGYATGTTFRSDAGPYLARADIGVAIFFLISGFLLYRPFIVNHLAERPRPATGAYLRRRFLRIFPAYWAALVLISVFIGFGAGQNLNGAWSWICHLLLIQVYQPDQFFRGITQSWTLSVELSFYLFLPAYALGIRWVAARRPRRDAIRVELAGLAVLVVVGLGFNALMEWGGWTYLTRVGKAWLPANLDLFAIGMGLALVSAWIAERGETPPLVEQIGRIGGWWWFGAAVAFWTVSTQLGLTSAITPIPDTGVGPYLEHYLYGVVAAFLLLPVVFGTNRRGVVRSLLRFAPIAWLGLISYGIYLWHQGWIKEAQQWTGSGAFQGSFLEIFAIVLACTIPTAALSYYLLERPVLRLKDWRRSARPVSR